MNPSKNRSGSIFADILSSLFILGSVLLLAYFGYTYFNPYHALNPFQPPTPTHTGQFTPVETPTLLPTEAALADFLQLAEVTAPALPTETPIILVTETPMPFPTATPVVINTLVDTPTVEPMKKFVAQEGTPDYIPYSGGCGGLYVAGHITDRDHNPVMLMTVRAEGTLGGEEIFVEVFSGSNTDYTISGWEIKLSDSLIASSGEIVISLYEQGGWEPISDEVHIDTFADCTRNLVVVNFVQE